MLPAAVHIQALTKQWKTLRGSPVHTYDDVLDSQPSTVRRPTGHDVGDDDSKISLQVQTGSQFRRDGLENGSNFRLVDVAIFYELRIGIGHYARWNREA